MTNLGRTTTQLRSLRDRWPDLLALRLPGTPRPWAEQARKRADSESDSLVRHPVPTALPPTPAPLRIDLVDTIVAVEWALLELEDAVRDALGWTRTCGRCRHEATAHDTACLNADCPCPDYRLERRAYTPGGTGLRWSDTDPWEIPAGAVHWAAVWLEDRLPAIAGHADLAEHVADTVADLSGQVNGAVGEHDDTVLKGLCPYCGGGEAQEFTLRLSTGLGLSDKEPYVICTNPDCDPPESGCATRMRGRPCWRYEDFEWLNALIDGETARLSTAS